MGKIGVLGGTFNPIHNGHLRLANEAYKALKLNKVLIMPTGLSYLKTDVNILSKDIRSKMVQLAIEDYEYFDFSDIEIKKEGNTYTYETLIELHKKYPNDDIYFICGADTLFNIMNWKNPVNILNNCILTVMSRDDKNIDELNRQAEELKYLYNAEIVILNCNKLDISSSEIRNYILNNDISSIKDKLPEKVLNYIIENNLYISIEE